MADSRLLAQIQHTIQYPSAHLDPRVPMVAPAACAIGGPAFEMGSPDQPMATEPQRPATEPAEPATPGQSIDSPIGASDACKRFVTAGRAIFTLQGKDSRYTFRVNRAEPKPGSQYTQPAYFVSLLTGPDNLDDYTYAGLLDVQTGQIRITRASKYTAESQPIKAFNWAIGRIWQGKPIAPAVFYHIGRCARCGRALTVPSSIETGLGPECAGKLEGI